jgi:3'-5' exoribonuclease
VARPKPPLVRLCELTPGQYAEFFALLSGRGKQTTRDGAPYYSCWFQDAKRKAAFKAWADSTWFEECEQQWSEGKFYKIRGVFEENEKYGPQIDIHKIRLVNQEDRADGFDPADFLDHSRYDPQTMLMELTALAQAQIADDGLRALVLLLLERHAEPLKRLPATLNKFYPFLGGLLEHTLSVTRSCLQLVEKYAAVYSELRPPLNRDLVVAGAILHDFGRILEFADDSFLPQPTIPGRLFGHLFLGRDLVRDAAREIPDINPELLQILEHIIITHLNLPEWGSPKLPLVPECLIIHHADDLDAKMEMYMRCLTRDQSQGPFTDRDPVLNRQLFKGRSV